MEQALEEGIEMLAEMIVHNAWGFTCGVRVQMLINRSIGNSNKGSKRWVSKLISTSHKEFKQNIIKLLHQMHHLGNPGIRLYSCVNERSLEKGVKRFMTRQIEVMNRLEEWDFYKDIQNNMVSCLMKPESRQGRGMFLVDIDSKHPVTVFGVYRCLKENNIEVFHKYETPNGIHVITKPFNPRLLSHIKKVEVKKDGLLLLHYKRPIRVEGGA